MCNWILWVFNNVSIGIENSFACSIRALLRYFHEIHILSHCVNVFTVFSIHSSFINKWKIILRLLLIINNSDISDSCRTWWRHVYLASSKKKRKKRPTHPRSFCNGKPQEKFCYGKRIFIFSFSRRCGAAREISYDQKILCKATKLSFYHSLNVNLPIRTFAFFSDFGIKMAKKREKRIPRALSMGYGVMLKSKYSSLCATMFLFDDDITRATNTG